MRSTYHFIVVAVTGVAAGMVVALHGMIPAAFAGLALAYSGQLTGIMQYTVRLATETESRFMSVQRMHTYLKVEQEKFIYFICVEYCLYRPHYYINFRLLKVKDQL